LGLFVVAVTSGLLMKMDLWSYFVMAVVVAVSIAIGHWLGQRRRRANHHDDGKRAPVLATSHIRSEIQCTKAFERCFAFSPGEGYNAGECETS